MRLVLDVSNQNPLHPGDLEASGAVALIGKATEGATFKDKHLPAARKAAKSAGVPFGSYVFLKPNSRGSEAAHYLEYARPRPGDIEPIVDAEDTSHGVDALAHRAHRCLTALEHDGYRPILYASSSIWLSMIRVEPRLKRFRVWEAQYPGRLTRWSPRLAKLRIRLRHGVTVVMWQWTSTLEVDGRHYDASALLAPLDSIRIVSDD